MSRTRSHSRSTHRNHGNRTPQRATRRWDGSASPNHRHTSRSPTCLCQWETTLHEVQKLGADPMQLYELLMEERDPKRFIRKLREAQQAVEGRQQLLERSIRKLERGRRYDSSHRSRSQQGKNGTNGIARHSQSSPAGGWHRPPTQAAGPLPPSHHKHHSPEPPAAAPPWPQTVPALPFSHQQLKQLHAMQEQLRAMQAGATLQPSLLPHLRVDAAPSIPPQPPIPSLSTSQPQSSVVAGGQQVLMTLLQPLALTCHSGLPLIQQPILNFKDGEGRLLRWTQPVEAVVQPMGKNSAPVQAMGTVAVPNDIGMAIFCSLGFLGEEGQTYMITFRSQGAEDLIVEGIEVVPNPANADRPASRFVMPNQPPVPPSKRADPQPSQGLSAETAASSPPRTLVAAPHGQVHERRPSEETQGSVLHASHSFSRRQGSHNRSLSFPRQQGTAVTPTAAAGPEDGILARHAHAPFWKRKGKVKTNRLGGEVYKGHPSHHIMQAMKEGIITSVRYVSTLPLRPLTAANDFGSSAIRRKYRKSTHGKLGGSAMTLSEATMRRRGTARTARGFHFCDYNPTVFRQIRECFGIDTTTYTRSLSDVWTTLKTPGKSRALLYFAGMQFVIKTLTKPESKFLRSILYGYFRHVQANPNTLLTRFYGHHCLTSLANNKQIRFVVMNNVFQTENFIHTKFDVKGSEYGRVASEQEKQSGSCIYKDLDFKRRKLWIGPERRGLFLTQVGRDVEFLKRMSIMDYSMLVGIHDAEAPTQPQDGHTRSVFVCDEGGMGSYTQPEIYYIGIIDILQDFNLWKRAEYTIRSIIHGKKTISAVPPAAYAARFLDFITGQVE
eukprot:GGOE01002579.1.p1 GENE.GGOE01002579.1~~GGOE01002579.1.p1  ORF type:complete len:836 (-),score=181.47 GGOE01002579.1:184-2691(-)